MREKERFYSEREREREREREKQRDAIADASSSMQWQTGRDDISEGSDYGHGGWGLVRHKEKISSRKGELIR